MYTDNKNGFGFEYATEALTEPAIAIFPVDAEAVLGLVEDTGSALVVAEPGAGKSHLVQDVMQQALQDRPVLKIAAHINGGKKAGVDNALFVIGAFAEQNPDGLLIADNADYYGYSGTNFSRRFATSNAHSQVASFLAEVILDDQTPDVLGTAHPQDWRDTHWLFGQKYPDETVTATAQTLLDSFASQYDFKGEVDEVVATRVLMEKVDGLLEALAIPRIISAVEEHAGCLVYRYFKHLHPGLGGRNITSALAEIDEGTQSRMGKTQIGQESLNINQKGL